MKSTFENCIRCTICVEECPAFKANPRYPGPKQAGPDAERFRLDGIETVDDWIMLCTQCRRCDEACPHGVEPSKLILNAQVRYTRHHHKTLPQFLFSNFHRVSRLGSMFAALTNLLTSTDVVRKMFRLMGLRSDVPFPRFMFHTLQRFRKPSVRSARAGKTRTRKAAFFHGCYLNANAPGEGRMIIAILEKLGVKVAVPDQVCCGLPSLGNGDRTKARSFATRNTAELITFVDAGWDIIYSCTSCGHTLIYDYPDLLGTDEGRRIAENTWNLYEYLLMLRDEESISFDFEPVRKTVSYHIPCHLRGRGVPYPVSAILADVPGLALDIQDENCCGFSGSYGFKEKNRETADMLGRLATDALLGSHPDIIISDCGSCRMQISNFTGTTVADPIHVLYEAFGLAASDSAERNGPRTTSPRQTRPNPPTVSRETDLPLPGPAKPSS